MYWEMHVIFDFMYVTQNGVLLHNTAQLYISLHAVDFQIDLIVNISDGTFLLYNS